MELTPSEQKVIDFLKRHAIVDFTHQVKKMTIAQRRRLRKRIRATGPSERFKGMLEQL